ncbi:DUF445 family protein [Haloplasma contractile]|uniref:Membrane protein n=1 Tax=Haloplasma contractile SSD-17B TaxID=1033810 RepID=U2EFW5_9MOLU|nr:DUF445 family protein [Haloplasma contractile]ERJ13506.1 Putative membrane protein [Haloplasma contractile SSD-17B]
MLDVTLFIIIGINIIIGAWTGYITNDVAIKMLFREYGIGKLKFGGIIVKTRKDLEKNIAELVEDEIINHNTLKEQLHKPEVKEAVTKVVTEFFNESIYEHTQNSKLEDIPGFNQSVEHILTFLDEYLHNNLSYTFIKLGECIELNDLLSREQVYNLSRVLTEELMNILKNESVIKDVIVDLYKNYNDLSIDDVLGKQLVERFINNLNELLNTMFDELRYKYSRDISMLINKIYRDIEMDDFIEQFEQHLGEKKINEFISEEGLHKLYDFLNEYLNDDSSKDSIDVFCEGIFIALKNVKKPIIELFSGDLRVEVEKFLENQLPGIIEKLIAIVQENSHEIEDLIESSIDQTIENQGAIKKIILSAIRTFLIENFTKRYDIINKMVEMLQNVDIDDLSDQISQQVIDFLHEKSISDIIKELEDNNLLNSNLISTQVHRSIKFLMERYLSSDVDHKEFLNKQVNKLLELNLKTFFNQTTVSFVTKQVLTNETLFDLVKGKLSEALIGLSTLPTHHFIKEEKIHSYASKVEQELSNYLVSNRDKVLVLIFENLELYVNKHDLSSLFSKRQLENNELNLKSYAIIDIIVGSIRTLIENNKSMEIYDLYNKVNSYERLSEDVTGAILEYLDRNLESVLRHNVAKVVEQNISDLSNKEVLELMEEFMGKRLKPLTILGAIFGGSVGALLGYITAKNGGDLNFFASIFTYLKNGFVYAALGYLTNVMAIFFIFRPYKPIFGIKQTQGIIAKQIPVFAKAMGNVVSKNLLAEETLNRIFSSNEQKIKSDFRDNIKRDNYKVIRSYLLENTDHALHQSSEITAQYLKKNSRKLATNLVNEALDFDLSKVDAHIFIEILSKLVVDKVYNSKEQVMDYMLKQFKSSVSINDLFSELNITALERRVENTISNESEKWIKKLSDQDALSKFIYSNKNKFDKIVNKPLNEVLPDSVKGKIESFLLTIIKNHVFAPKGQTSISNYTIEKLSEIFNNTSSVDELFGGKFFELVDKNMKHILDRIEYNVILWLKNNKQEIIDLVRFKVKEKLGLMHQVGYTAVSGDRLISDIVNQIINEKFPIFIEDKVNNLHEEFNKFFDDLGKLQLRDADIELRKDELNAYIKSVFESEEINVKTSRFIHVILTNMFEFESSKFFDMFDIHSVHDLLIKYDDSFRMVNKGIYESLSHNREKIVYELNIMVNKLLTHEVLSSKIRNLTLGLNKQEVEPFINHLFEMLNTNNFLYNETYNIMEHITTHFAKLNLSDIFEGKYLKQDLKKLLQKLGTDQQFYQAIYDVGYNLYSLLTDQFDDIVDARLKERVLNDVTDSTFDVVSRNMSYLLTTIDLKEVTIREIESMDPKEIKNLFDSFASKYFRKLEAYGFFGGLFAVPYVTGLSFIVYLIANARAKTVENN